MAPDLQVSVSREGGSAVVRVRGELDLATAGLLEGRLRDLLEPRRTDPVDHLVVDTAGVSFVDVAGLRVLLTAVEALYRRGGSALLHAPSRQVQRLLDLLGVDLSHPTSRDG